MLDEPKMHMPEAWSMIGRVFERDGDKGAKWQIGIQL